MKETVQLFGLKRCSTCIKAMSWLGERQLSYEFVDYRDNPVPRSVLSGWKDQLGGWEKLVNRSSTTWRQLPDERKAPASDAAWLDLIQAYPTLVRRPVRVDADGAVTVGFSAAKYEQLGA